MSNLNQADWFDDRDSIASESKQAMPAHDDVAKLAYELWEQRRRNGEDGSAEQDWFDAERLLHPGERIVGA